MDTTEGTDDQEDCVRNLFKRRETTKCQGSCRRSRGESEVPMQRALSALDQDGLTITNRTSGRCVTEDVTKIEECRKDIAHKIVKQYIRDLEELGYNKEDAVALIGKEEEE